VKFGHLFKAMGNQQLRKNLKWTLATHFRYWRNKQRLGACGPGTFFESGVSLMRFPRNIFLGANLVLKTGARLCACNEQATIRIGENTTIGYHTYLFASAGISIGDNCLIAPFVYLVDSDHRIERQELINRQPNQTAPIAVGNDVWIGTGAKILKGVTIGDGAVIAAGALVKDDVAPYTIVGGIPAKKISERK
jgi:acetyltransferase-like isoleucine patch superfamily enzyme